MKNRDPRPGSQKVTNQDEQDVVVNHSTSSDTGYDEPITDESLPRADKSEGDEPQPEKKISAQKIPRSQEKDNPERK